MENRRDPCLGNTSPYGEQACRQWNDGVAPDGAVEQQVQGEQPPRHAAEPPRSRGRAFGPWVGGDASQECRRASSGPWLGGALGRVAGAAVRQHPCLNLQPGLPQWCGTASVDSDQRVFPPDRRGLSGRSQPTPFTGSPFRRRAEPLKGAINAGESGWPRHLLAALRGADAAGRPVPASRGDVAAARVCAARRRWNGPVGRPCR